jgi:hypothetical protein
MPRSSQPRHWPLFFVLWACYRGGRDDAADGGETSAPSSAGEASSGRDAETGGRPESGDGAGTVEGDGSEESSTSPLDPEASEPAGGVLLGSAWASQGVDVALFADGAPSDPASRNVPLIAGRPMLVRLAHDLAADFVPRPIEGRLVLRRADGTTEVRATP